MASPVVFNHIPKTAGTALTHGIVDALGAKRVRIAVDRFTLGDDEVVASFSSTTQRLFVTDPAQLPAEVDVIGGHVTPSTSRARYPDARDLTVLRESRSRLLSGWLFSRSHTDRDLRHYGRFGELIRRSRLPLADYLADPEVAAHTDNVMLRFLVWPHPAAPPDAFITSAAEDELLAAARGVIAGFSHVDIIESPDFLSDLSSWLGAEVKLATRNPTQPVPEAWRPDLPAELSRSAGLVEERTRLDHVLWSEIFDERPMGHDAEAFAKETYERAVQRYDERLSAPPPPRPSVTSRAVGRVRRRVRQWRTTRS